MLKNYFWRYFIRFFSFQAKRANVHTVILPFENQKDYNDLQDFIKDGLTVHFAKTYDDVYKIIFDDK
jgi:ATP-dependent Lon protease